MGRRLAAAAVLLAVLLLGIVGGIALDQNLPLLAPALVFPGESQAQRQEAAVVQALQVIHANYYESGQAAAAAQGGLQGMVQGLGDPFSRYLTASEWRAQNASYAGEHRGVIGISVGPSAQGPLILSVLPGSPAAAAGLAAGDVILTVDGRSTQGLAIGALPGLVDGRSGTQVTLEVSRQGSVRSVRLTRSTFTSPSVVARRLASGILYVRIYEFDQATASQFAAALAKDATGERGLVLDLRGNPGGLVSAAKSVIQDFVAGGVAYSVEGRYARQVVDVSGHALEPKLPLVVLVDANTASASEIVAGALQAHGRARLVGEKTYGKGSVQEDFPLANGGDLHLTVEHWYLPGGGSVQGVGLVPDLTVALGALTTYDVVSATGEAQDHQLQAALGLIGGG